MRKSVLYQLKTMHWYSSINISWEEPYENADNRERQNKSLKKHFCTWK